MGGVESSGEIEIVGVPGGVHELVERFDRENPVSILINFSDDSMAFELRDLVSPIVLLGIPSRGNAALTQTYGVL